MFNTIFKNGAMLAAFALITTALISVTFVSTKDSIAEQQRQRLLGVLNEVVPGSMYSNKLYADCTLIEAQALGTQHAQRIYRARLDGEPAALALQTTAPDGYSGDIDLVVGVDTQMNVLGVRVVNHKETPGLGDKVELAVSDWILSFTDEKYTPATKASWKVKKDGGKFDQFTGATITPRAVVGAVRSTLQYVQNNQSRLFAAPANCYAE